MAKPDLIDRIEVAELNLRYGAPLQSEQERNRFFQLFHGHPALVRLGLDTMVIRGLSVERPVISPDCLRIALLCRS